MTGLPSPSPTPPEGRAIVTLSFTLDGGSIDDMNDCASKIITAAVKAARRGDLRIHFTRESEENAR